MILFNCGNIIVLFLGLGIFYGGFGFWDGWGKGVVSEKVSFGG